jgi:hypothetical protein
MSDDNDGSEEGLPSVQDVEIVDAKDWFLQSAVETLANNGVEFSITLTVGGLIVSGTLISGRTYFTELAEFVRKSSKSEDDLQGQMAEGWGAFAKLYDPPEGAGEDWTAPTASFIHLRDAVFFTPGQPRLPTNGGMLWRAKITAVDGFSLVSISGS